MENLKENIEKIKKIQKQNYILKENIKISEQASIRFYESNQEEFKKQNEKIKKDKNKIELNNLKIAILKNNLHYLLKVDFLGIQNKMIEYYEKAKIGVKTKEKIEEELKKYYKDNFNVDIGCYLTTENTRYSSEFKLTIYFLNNEGFKDFVLGYNEEFAITFQKWEYNNFELSVSYYHNIDEYVNLENVDKKATELLKEYNKTKEKIEKLRLKQKEYYHNFKDYIQGFTSYQLDINSNLHIY
jgi:hypothetical protein